MWLTQPIGLAALQQTAPTVQSFYNEIVTATQSSRNQELTLYLHMVSTSRRKGTSKEEGQVAHKVIRREAISEQASRPVKSFILEHSRGLRSHFGGFRYYFTALRQEFSRSC